MEFITYFFFLYVVWENRVLVSNIVSVQHNNIIEYIILKYVIKTSRYLLKYVLFEYLLNTYLVFQLLIRKLSEVGVLRY